MGTQDLAFVAAVSLVGFACGFVLMGSGGTGQEGRRRPAWDRDRLPGPLRAILSQLERSAEAGRLRQARMACVRDLPLMLDVLTLGLLAGLSFDASLELYCQHEEGDLADRLRSCLLTWRIGVVGRAQALRSLADDLESPAFARFADAVAQALEFGSPLAEVLSDQARLMRDERQAQLEEEIERVPVRILIPMGTLIVPAMLLAIMGPLLAGTVGAL